ncbi:hypothetical protein [Rummeliibacillus stabekisii]|uniref:hypothetical protein n=1 Tax=Rummeliibacillus stabekisii TaxID=241244 RepID=UPI00371D3A28
MKPADALKKMQLLNQKEQLAFLLNNPNLFIDDVTLYILAVDSDLQERLPFNKYVQLLKKKAIQSKNIALLKACHAAEEINI